MSFMDDEKNIKIYIKDQLKELFYELDEMKWVIGSINIHLNI